MIDRNESQLIREAHTQALHIFYVLTAARVWIFYQEDGKGRSLEINRHFFPQKCKLNSKNSVS